MTTIVGLDLSFSSCGYAIWSTGDLAAAYGHWELSPSLKTAAKGCVRLHKHLSALAAQHGGIDIIALEASIPAHKKRGMTNAKTTWAQAGLEFHALSFAEAVGARWHRINIGAWRSAFLGQMPAQSNLDWKTMAQVRAREFGMSTAVHDEAEAIGVLDYQIGQEGITPPWRMAAPLLRDLGLDAA